MTAAIAPASDDAKLGELDHNPDNCTLHFVPKEDIALWERRGWRVTNDLRGTSHGKYSVLMVKVENGLGQ